jgi:hypothetical protein
MGRKDIGCVDVDWIQVAQNMVHYWWAGGEDEGK